MKFPFEYDHGAPLVFGGALPEPRSFDDSQIVILPVPVDRTTSYVGGTRNGPREILQASSHMELWDEEVGADVHGARHLHAAGDGAAVRRDGAADGRDPARRIRDRPARQVPRDARRRAFDHAAARRRDRRALHAGCRVLQIDAHADLRDVYMGTPHNHACAMRRTLEHAPVTQVGIRSMSTEEAEAVAAAWDEDLLRRVDAEAIRAGSMRSSKRSAIRSTSPSTSTAWTRPSCPPRARPSPAACPGTRCSTLLRATFERRTVVACDVVELSPLPGLMAPNFLCAQAGLQDPDVSLRIEALTTPGARFELRQLDHWTVNFRELALIKVELPVYEVYCAP